MDILSTIKQNAKKGLKMLGILIDPDHFDTLEDLDKYLAALIQNPPHFIFIGGSLINNDLFEKSILRIKEKLTIPLVIFPGNQQQISNKADGILLLSLISGRNSDFLIGQHVNSAFKLKRSGLEIIPTGYALVNCGGVTSAEYMSNTKPIPYTKNGIATATILAGEQLGLSIFYLDGGSGAEKPVSSAMIKMVKEQVKSPLIVGGGLKTEGDLKTAWESGADLVIIGTAFEQNPAILKLY